MRKAFNWFMYRLEVYLVIAALAGLLFVVGSFIYSVIK